MSDLTSLGAITALSYILGAFIKTHGKYTDYIPAICGLFGSVISGTYSAFTGGDILIALGYGAIAGIASTGVKELTKILGVLKNEQQENK